MFPTGYHIDAPAGLPGALDTERPFTVISRELESAALPFGQPAFRGSRDSTCAAIGGMSGLLGIAVMDPMVGPANECNYVFGDTVAILIEGFVWVRNFVPVTPGSPVYFDGLGNITSMAVGNTAVPRAKFETTAAAGKGALVCIK